MEVSEIKEYIIENDLILDILEHFGIEYNSKNNKYIHLSNQDGDNKNAICIYKNSLKVINYTRGWEGDIFNLIDEYMGYENFKSIIEVSNFLNLSNIQSPKKANIIKVLNDFEKTIKIPKEEELEVLSEDLINNKRKIPSQMFLDDGINLETQAEFEIILDLDSNSIMIPIRDEKNNLIGIKNRKNVLNPNNMKYYYSFPYKKSYILYNLYRAYESIKKHNKVIIFESEKSVMKAWQNGIECCVAICGSDLSIFQTIKLESLNVDIILAYDKDVELNLECDCDCSNCKIKCLKKEMSKFIPSTNVFCIVDDDNLLDEKDSPIDKGLEVFKNIYKNKYRR